MVTTRAGYTAAGKPSLQALHGGDTMPQELKHVDKENSDKTKISVASRSLSTFQYQELADGSTDIRLILLSPGSDNDPVSFQIQHSRLPEYDEPLPTSHKQTLQNLNNSLPSGWEAFETLEERIIFVNRALDASSWEHPGDPTIELPSLVTNAHVPGAPVFEALSYTWGTSHGLRAVFVVPDATAKPPVAQAKLLVTKNLYVALRHLRYPDRSRTLWVDSVCINQNDISERNAQVQRMPHIYRLAQRVVVWLGPGSHQSALAMSALRYLADQVQITRQGHTIRVPGAEQKHWYTNSHDLPYDTHTWHGIARLLQRLWFTRVWVVQEINLANQTTALIQCGGDVISWAIFRRAVICLSIKNSIPDNVRDQLPTAVQLATYDSTTASMKLIMSLYSRDCSDQRDRVYGLLGLMPKRLRSRIPVDYSLDVGEVFKSAALAQIEEYGRLDALRGCVDTGDDQEFHALTARRAIVGPSWVPDLITASPALDHMSMQFSSGISRCVARQVSPDMLEVVGVRVGAVSTVEHDFPLWPGEGLKPVTTWKLPDTKTPYPSGGTFLEALAMTLCSMRVKDRYPWLDGLPSLLEWTSYLQETVFQTTEQDPGSLDGKGNVSALFLLTVENALVRGKYFTTTDGYIGLGPIGLQTGDVISVLLGYEAPMVLRRTGSTSSSTTTTKSCPRSGDTYHIVGTAFIYGIHDAISILGPVPAPWDVNVHLDSIGNSTVQRFFNRLTGRTVDDDPRLDPKGLQGWEGLGSTERTADDPEVFARFRNLATGDVVNYDPRMSVDELRGKGVSLTSFRLL